MVTGQVTLDGEVIVTLPVAGRHWTAIVDTGFNGDLELPITLFELLNPAYETEGVFDLAGGQTIVQDVYAVEFPFDGESFLADATFVEDDKILIGTGMLEDYRLTVDFVARTVLLERMA